MSELEPDPTGPAAQPNGGLSTIEKIKARHKNKLRTLDLVIPRWGGEVIARVGPVSDKQLNKITRRKGSSARRINGELLSEACLEVLVLNDEGVLEPVPQIDGIDLPVRFDGRLADLFEVRGDSPWEIVVSMYRDNVALGRHAKRLLDWQSGEDLEQIDDDDIDGELDDLAGEAQATT